MSEDRSGRTDAAQPEFARIAKINDQKTLQEEIARLHSLSINALFASDSTQDFKNSAEVRQKFFRVDWVFPIVILHED